jgi:hypothetical protein
MLLLNVGTPASICRLESRPFYFDVTPCSLVFFPCELISFLCLWRPDVANLWLAKSTRLIWTVNTARVRNSISHAPPPLFFFFFVNLWNTEEYTSARNTCLQTAAQWNARVCVCIPVCRQWSYPAPAFPEFGHPCSEQWLLTYSAVNHNYAVQNASLRWKQCHFPLCIFMYDVLFLVLMRPGR